MTVSDLTGTTAIVTGVSRGFGRATAVTLAGLGAHVVGVARNRGLLGEVAGQIVDPLTADVADAAYAVVAARLVSDYRSPTHGLLGCGVDHAPAGPGTHFSGPANPTTPGNQEATQ